MTNFKKIIGEYEDIIDGIYGVYLDGSLGFKLIVQYISQIQEKTTARRNKDELSFIYGKGSPNNPDSYPPAFLYPRRVKSEE